MKVNKKAFIAGSFGGLIQLFVSLAIVTIVVALVAMILGQAQTSISTSYSPTLAGYNASRADTFGMAYNVTGAGLTTVNSANGYVGMFVTVAIFVLLLGMIMLLGANRRM